MLPVTHGYAWAADARMNLDVVVFLSPPDVRLYVVCAAVGVAAWSSGVLARELIARWYSGLTVSGADSNDVVRDVKVMDL